MTAPRMERERGGGPGVRARPHWVYFSGASGWVAFVALAATLLIRHNDLPAATDWKIVGIALLVAASGVVGPAVRWARTWVEIDAAHARCTSGVLRPAAVDVDVSRARAVAVDEGLLGRWLGYARLRVTDEHGGAHVFPPVGDVAAWRAVASRDPRSRGRRDRRDG